MGLHPRASILDEMEEPVLVRELVFPLLLGYGSRHLSYFSNRVR
jgi:hypothetical protein